MKSLQIVVDFDGTVTTHDFPKVGKDIGAAPVLKELVAAGHKLILFTMRASVMDKNSTELEYLTQAVKWFVANKIPLYGVQRDPKQRTWTDSPKAFGQLIIDDAALGIPLKFDEKLSNRPFVDWQKVRELLVQSKVLEK